MTLSLRSWKRARDAKGPFNALELTAVPAFLSRRNSKGTLGRTQCFSHQ